MRFLTDILQAYARFTRQNADSLRLFSRVLDALTVLCSVLVVVALTVYVGFDHDVIPFGKITPWLNLSLTVFAVNILFNFFLRFHEAMRETRLLKWLVDAIIIIVFAAHLIFRQPLSYWIIAPAVAIYSAVYICWALIRSLGRRTNPSLILSVSFLIVIALGSLLLMLPKCTYGGISPVDALFVSTSAVCICGLTSVDVAATFTPLGLSIIALMMQVGALGVMTITSSFALFFSGNASIYSQLLVRDMFYSRTINSLLPTLGYTLVFTLGVEALGAVMIFFSIRDIFPDMSLSALWATSGFHSLSAFCNAGFSNLPDGMANVALMKGNQLIYLVVSLLVIAGGIGFPILVNTKEAIAERISRVTSRLFRRPAPQRHPHLFNMNTRVALTTTSILFLLTFVLFLVFEWNGALRGMSPYAKLVQGVFNSTTPRSSGFVSVSPAGFMPVTLLMVMFMMWIGAGSQSTAGGIKVNTFAAAMLHLRGVVSGRRYVTAFNRRISMASLSRAQAVIILSLLSYALFAGVMLLLAPHFSTRDLLFETLSALFSVGSSMGITPALPVASKVVLCLAMFVGRVGLLSLLMGLVRQSANPPLTLPEDNLIIN